MMVRMGMELPIAVIRQQIATGIEIIVQLGRDAAGGRFVAQIAEVIGFDGNNVCLQSLYERSIEGKLEKKNELSHREKLEIYEAYKRSRGEQA